MKKILSAVAALGLVAGVASVASAADLSVTGKYVVEGVYTENAGATGFSVSQDAESDAYWMHTFQMLPTMKVNDNITMKSDIRLRKEARFGTSEDAGNGDAVDFNKIYMDYTSPVGKIRVGRTPAGAWSTPFLNSATAASRIMWWPKMSGPVSVLLFTQKSSEADSQEPANLADHDTDLYHVGVTYKADAGQVDVGYFYNRVGALSTTGGDAAVDTTITAAANYKFGNYSVVGELAMVGGEGADSDYATTGDVVDKDAMGLFLMGSGQFDALTVSAALVYASGDVDATDNENGALMGANGLGKDFQPLYVFTGDTMGILNGDEKAGVGTTAAAAKYGVKCYAVLADYKVSDRLTLHGALAMGTADDVAAGSDDDYGMEYDLGVAYKLLDNLTYSAQAGYVTVGDFFGADAEDITLLTHSLTMKF